MVRSSFSNADSPGGVGSLRQTLSGVCPGQRYNLEAFFGRSDNIITGSKVVTTIRVLLDGVEVAPPTFYCTLGTADCTLGGGSGPYRKVGPIAVTPQNVNPVLTFEIATDIPANAGIFSVDVFIDQVTFSRI